MMATAATRVGSSASITRRLNHRLARLEHGPVLVVAVVLALAVGHSLAVAGGNATGLVRFGSDYRRSTQPPAGAVVAAGAGYDGQYFWALARDPLLFHDGTVHDFRGAGFRLQRVAYPALAFVLAAGQVDALPWCLLGVNVLAVLAITGALARYARRRGWSPWWALAVGLLPGVTVATIGDMSDALATSLMLGGLMLWRSRRPWAAATLLAAATVAREAMVLAVVAIGAEMALRAVTARRPRTVFGAGREVSPGVQAAWPVMVVPAVVFAGWQIYLRIRFPGSLSAPASAYQAPFTALYLEARHALRSGPALGALWDLAYLSLMMAGIGASLRLSWRSPSAYRIAALLFGLSLLVLTFGSDWSYTRLSAPMFAALLLAGLEAGDRTALIICSGVAALGLVGPLVLA
jgi:hypothetical protein